MKRELRLIITITLAVIQTTFCVGASAQGIIIDAYGDSTTEGWTVKSGIGFRSDHNEPNLVQTMLQGRYGDQITVVNYGVEGIQASQLLNGAGNRIRPWSLQMSMSNAKIVLINLGQNDALYANVVASKSAPETPEDYAQIMTQLIAIAKAAGKVVVLEEPNPSCMRTRAKALPAYVAKLREVARQQDVRLVSQFDDIQSMAGWTNLLSDCVHPTELLYRQKAQRSAEVLAPIVESMLRRSQ